MRVVDGAHDGVTLAALVREALGTVPWSRARELCTSGRVRVGGAVVLDGARRLRAGDEVAIDPAGPRRREGALPPEALVFVDRDVVVVDKPAGVLSCPYEDGDKDTLVDLARAALRRLERGGRERYDPELGVVHRLDKDTTGLLVFTRTLPAKRALESQFRAHTTERRYLALVHGIPADATHDTLLVPDRGDGLRGSWGVFRQPRGRPPADARKAVTHVRVVERLAGAALVECVLETGRQHQIRIHLSEAGHPLVGEPVYIRDHRGPRLPAPRPMLHAAHLGFVHPRTDETLRFEREPPADFQSVLGRLRRAR